MYVIISIYFVCKITWNGNNKHEMEHDRNCFGEGKLMACINIVLFCYEMCRNTNTKWI